MALVAGNEVALMNGDPFGAANPFNRNGDILFGRVIAVGATVDVLWENGQYTETVVAAIVFDKIDAVSDVVAQGVQGKVVYPLTPANNSFGNVVSSPEYRCIVVRVYQRQRDGAGEQATYVLLRSLQTGQLFESLLSQVALVDGQ